MVDGSHIILYIINSLTLAHSDTLAYIERIILTYDKWRTRILFCPMIEFGFRSRIHPEKMETNWTERLQRINGREWNKMQMSMSSERKNYGNSFGHWYEISEWRHANESLTLHGHWPLCVTTKTNCVCVCVRTRSARARENVNREHSYAIIRFVRDYSIASSSSSPPPPSREFINSVKRSRSCNIRLIQMDGQMEFHTISRVSVMVGAWRRVQSWKAGGFVAFNPFIFFVSTMKIHTNTQRNFLRCLRINEIVRYTFKRHSWWQQMLQILDASETCFYFEPSHRRQIFKHQMHKPMLL